MFYYKKISLIENIHREDLTSIDKAHFIKKIWKQMGKPEISNLVAKLSMSRQVIEEHLSLVDESTPKAVKKAVEKGKLAMKRFNCVTIVMKLFCCNY